MTDLQEEEISQAVEEVPVMLFYEEPEHLRLLIRSNSGIVTRYLTREDAATMLKWIGAKGTTIKSDVILPVLPI